MEKANSSDLWAAVEGLHEGQATFDHDVAVIEQFDGATVWEGVVSVFNLEGHPDTDTCYTWSEPVKCSDKRRFFAVLKVPPVDSPEAAVRASIMADHKAAQKF